MSSNSAITIVLSIAIFLSTPLAFGKKVARTVNGESVFQQRCASCHTAGGNIVKPGKPVTGSSKLATLGVFKQYLASPVGHMPYYKELIANPTVLKSLYNYCKTLQPAKQS